MSGLLNFKLPDLKSLAPKSQIDMITPPDELAMIESEAAPPDGTSGGLDYSSISEGLNKISPQDELNQKFMERNKNIMKSISGASSASNTVAGIAGKLGPWGMLASAGLKAGDALNKSATDEFGVVKDKTKAIAAGILNPITGISTALGQKDRKKAKSRFVNTELSTDKADLQVQGNRISNSIPKYTPPAYGRFGGKLTKFTK